ncbi:MAG: hypothetical protein ACREI9_10465 [Nitrospiraceae bacterium]
MARQRSGHLIFYGPNNRRILATDPDGNPLHECEWGKTASGRTKLVRARIHLEWGQWVGLKPDGMVNATTLDLSKKPGWQRLQADDLRKMAAQAMRVPFEEVKFFYGDEDLVIDQRGTATIQHKKDAFYVLDDGTFDRTRFMACMGAMHWAGIDFLPVVELFQSLLPGTGSAAFELIRSLYDDQNEGAPLPLRYRGIPTYPSEAAFRLFSSFFTPQAPGGGNPLPIFMEVGRSHEVTWLPAPNPPLRFFDTARHLCVTVKGQKIQKVIKQDDPAGLPFVQAAVGMPAPFERSVTVTKGALLLKDRETCAEVPIQPTWGTLQESLPIAQPLAPVGWPVLFGGTPPAVTPHEAFSAVLLYPEDETEINELASQPFVADYLQDSFEQNPTLAAALGRAKAVLIDHFDATIATCVSLDRPRSYTALYRHPAYAQKQAQALWQTLARAQRLDWVKGVSFLPETARNTAYGKPADLLFAWIPFAAHADALKLHEAVRAITGALAPSGMAFIVGPSTMQSGFQVQQLRVQQTEPVESLPTFRMHQTILPKARLKPGLTIFLVAKE